MQEVFILIYRHNLVKKLLVMLYADIVKFPFKFYPSASFNQIKSFD